MRKKTVTLAGGKVFEITEEKYSDRMAYLEEIFAVTDDAAAEKDIEKAKVKLQTMNFALFAIENRYNDKKLKACVLGGDADSLTVSESKELLQAIDDFSKDGIAEKN